MLAVPMIVEHRETGVLGVALSRELVHAQEGAFFMLFVAWDDEHHSCSVVPFEQVKWLSIPSVSDVEDSPLTDLLMEEVEESQSEENSEEPEETSSETEEGDEHEEAGIG